MEKKFSFWKTNYGDVFLLNSIAIAVTFFWNNKLNHEQFIVLIGP